jgi:TPR repeat protein
VFESGVYHPQNNPDFILALKYFSESAEKHYAKAQLKLAEYYSIGKGGERDPAKAAEWLMAAAKLHNPEAQFRLGELYESGLNGVQQDYSEAKKWYEKAASQEYLPAFLKIAKLFENGHGVEKDVDRALKLYVDAEALGESAARQHIERISRTQAAY